MNIFFTKKLILFSLLFSFYTFGQGIMRGIVTDSVNSQALIGANVYLEGTSLGAATDLEGHYSISSIPAGKYRVRFSYIGYNNKYAEVTILNKKTITLNIKLAPIAIQGKEVVVTAQALGQTSAINQQLSSNTIVNVVSEEKIQQLPDANAAEALGRLPGVAIERSGGEANQIVLRGMAPQFTNVTIDGMSLASTDSADRGVDLSTISQGTLAGIELYKALTSDKDGDAIAGTVNLVTKKAPFERLLWVDSKGVYNNLDKSFNQYDLNLRYGERFFKNILGVQVTGAIEQRIRSNEQNQYGYDLTTYKSGLDYSLNNFTLNYTNELRKRDNVGLLLDINTPDSGSIRINNIYDKTSRNYITYGRNYLGYNPGNVNTYYSARDVKQDIISYNGFITGDNYLFGLTENWGLSFAQGSSQKPYDYQMDFTEPDAMNTVPPSLQHGPPEAIISYAKNNYNAAYLYDSYDRSDNNLDKQSVTFLNLTKKYSFDESVSGELKGGVKYKSNTKYDNGSELLAPYYINGFYQFERLSDGTIVKKNLKATPFGNLAMSGSAILVTNFLDSPPETRKIYNIYTLSPLINRTDLEAWRTLNINGVQTASGAGPEYSANNAVTANDYYITEKIYAGYLMNTLNIGREITFITGLRVESESNVYNSKYSPYTLSGFPTPSGQILDTTSTHKETNWLPNFQLLYKPFDFMNVRFAAYRALSRPDFTKRLATYITRAAGTFYPNNSLQIGNPGLKDASAWNYEINTSFYGNYIGLFSISAYFKNITNMYHTINGLQISGSTNPDSVLRSLGVNLPSPYASSDFNLTYQTNSDKATYVWGFEIEHQINFWFLPWYLHGLVLSYNFSIIRSQTYIPINGFYIDTTYTTQFGKKIPHINSIAYIVDRKQNLEGSPNFIGNVSFGYDIGGFSIRLSLFYQSQSNYLFSSDGRNDIVTNGFTRLDLSAKQVINDYISVMLNLNNLTNVQEGQSIYDHFLNKQLLSYSQKYGLTGDLGVRITL